MNGFVVNVKDECHLASAMEIYLLDQDIYSLHSENALNFGKTTYDVKSINKIFIENLLTEND